MPKVVESPLTKEQQADLRQALARVHRLLPKLDQYEACGIQCDVLRAEAMYVAEQLQLLISVLVEGKTPQKG